MTPVEVVRAHHAALNSHDMDAIASFYAEDVVCSSPNGTNKSRAARMAAWKVQFDATPDWHADMTRITEAGNRVVSELVTMMTFERPADTPFGRLEPTGRTARFRVCVVATVVGDVITEERAYFDLTEFYRAFGLLQTGG